MFSSVFYDFLFTEYAQFVQAMYSIFIYIIYNIYSKLFGGRGLKIKKSKNPSQKLTFWRKMLFRGKGLKN